MSNFKKMDKSDKLYEAKLSQFRWPDAEDAVGMGFMDKGKKEAKAMIAQALSERIKEPYGKIGKIKRNLVFRIKYNKKHHYGEEDIILIRGFDGVEEVSLSSKDKNVGVLSVSRERDPVSVKWWSETLGGERDELNLEPLLLRYGKLREIVLKRPMSRAFEETLATLDRIETTANRALSAYPAKNDQKLLGRLVSGVSIHQNNIRQRNDAYQAALGTALKKLVNQIKRHAKEALEALDAGIKQVENLKGFREYERAGREAQATVRGFERSRDMLDDEQTKEIVARFAREEDVSQDDLERPALQQVARVRPLLDNRSRDVDALRDAITELGTVSADPALDKAWKQLEAMLEKLRDAEKKTADAAGYAVSLFETPMGYTNRGKTGEEWHPIVQGSYDKLAPMVDALVSRIDRAQKTVKSDNAVGIAFLNKLKGQCDMFVSDNMRRLKAQVDQMNELRDNVGLWYKGMIEQAERYTDKLEATLAKDRTELDGLKSGEAEEKDFTRIRNRIGEYDQMNAQSYNGIKLQSGLGSLINNGLLGVQIPKAKRALDRYDNLIRQTEDMQAEIDAVISEMAD